MNQSVLVHADVDEGPKVRHVGDDAGARHAGLQILQFENVVTVLEQRESERGNRQVGRAKEQYEQGLIHALNIYDLEVDTTHQTVEKCALEIKRHLEHGAAPTAFKKIAQLSIEELWRMTDAMDRSIYQAAHPELSM